MISLLIRERAEMRVVDKFIKQGQATNNGSSGSLGTRARDEQDHPQLPRGIL